MAVYEGGIVLCEQKQMQEVIDAMFERKVNIFLFQFICFGKRIGWATAGLHIQK